MAKRTKLSYQDFRPLRKGEAGFSKTKRTMVSESTGKRMPYAKFKDLAKEAASIPKTQKAVKPNKQYTQFISKFVDKQNRELAANNLNPTFSRGEARTNPQFKKAYADLKREGKKKKMNRSAHGSLAQALEDLGLREENADYPVGETPD